MLSARQIRKMQPWGPFPCRLRRFYIAQNGKCAYCGNRMALVYSNNNFKRFPLAASRDHVRPKSKGHKLEMGNKVLACSRCQHAKGARDPRPCELFYAAITAEIVVGLTP